MPSECSTKVTGGGILRSSLGEIKFRSMHGSGIETASYRGEILVKIGSLVWSVKDRELIRRIGAVTKEIMQICKSETILRASSYDRRTHKSAYCCHCRYTTFSACKWKADANDLRHKYSKEGDRKNLPCAEDVLAILLKLPEYELGIQTQEYSSNTSTPSDGYFHAGAGRHEREAKKLLCSNTETFFKGLLDERVTKSDQRYIIQADER